MQSILGHRLEDDYTVRGTAGYDAYGRAMTSLGLFQGTSS